MRRWAALLWAALSLLVVPAASAAPCPADDPNRIATLPLPPELAAIVGEPPAGDAAALWRDTSTRIDQLRQRARREASGPGLAELAAFLDDVLAGYDGTHRTARTLSLADVKAETCPGDVLTSTETCAWETLRGKVRPSRDDHDPWSCEAKTRLGVYLAAAQTLIRRLVDPAVRDSAEDLTRFAAEWRRYVENGFSQYPWEVLLNGVMLDEDGWAPPPNQLIALHPAVGFGTANLTEERGDKRTGALVLAIETVGYVRYWSDFRHHVGLSATAALSNFAWKQTGLGPVVHFDGVGLGYAVGLHGDHEQTVYVLYDVTRGIDDSRLGRRAKGWIQEQLP